MVDQTATNYFDELSELMRSVEVTDDRGAVLSLDNGANTAAELLHGVRSSNGKVMVVGNGGSASIASHMQNDLCKAVGIRALVFNEPPLLTALSNDHGYECVFERPVELWAEPGDALVAISSSGRSENILGAVRTALKAGGRVITFSGFGADNPLRQLGQLNFYVPSTVYGYVESVHAALGHFLTDRAAMLVGGEDLTWIT